MLDFIRSRYKIRQCLAFKQRTRPCLNYQIKKCSAPCAGKISKEGYREEINQIISLLEGKTSNIIKQLDKEIRRSLKKTRIWKGCKFKR